MRSTWLAIVGSVTVVVVAFAQYFFVLFLLLNGLDRLWPRPNNVLVWVMVVFVMGYPFIVLFLMLHALQKAWGLDKGN